MPQAVHVQTDFFVTFELCVLQSS